MLLPLQGATAPTRDTQGVASLALGYVLHWAFSPPLLNLRLEFAYSCSYIIHTLLTLFKHTKLLYINGISRWTCRRIWRHHPL